MHVADADIRIHDGAGLFVCKTTQLVYNSTSYSLLKHGFWLVKNMAVNSTQHSFLCNNNSNKEAILQYKPSYVDVPSDV